MTTAPKITALAPWAGTRWADTMAYALWLVGTGTLVVQPDGTVWRHKEDGRPCEPRRAENPTRKGYLVVTLGVPGTRKTRGVMAHRLVWTVLRGPIPEGLQINHKDKNKANNHPDNLEVVTGTENIRHSMARGHTKAWTYATEWRPGKPRLGPEIKEKARYLRQSGSPTSRIAGELGISKSHVERLCKGIPAPLRKRRVLG